MAMVALLALLAISIQDPLKGAENFPIAVWLQDPSQASRYKAAGFNLYVGLWEGPTERQLDQLRSAGMPVVCDQNAVGLKHKADPTIAGWMHQDEPDNAQPAKDAEGKDTWGPCVPPLRIVDRYREMKLADPDRPVLLNLGQGVANDEWIGRGNGARLDDYKTYVQGADIVSFDVYPVAGLGDPAKIPLIAKGLGRLQGWTLGKKRIWNCIECTAISGKSKPTPQQVRAEAWLSIIRGSRGLIFFVHQFKPRFDEHALLDDPPMLEAVKALNSEIRILAKPLNQGRTEPIAARGVEVLGKRLGSVLTIMAVNPTGQDVEATFAFAAAGGVSRMDEVGGIRRSKTGFSDHFGPFQVHLYRMGR